MAGHVDRVGQQVGEYRLLHWIGGGGFGDVYLAEHLREHTQVAIKVLQAKLSRQEDLKEFINEARTIYLQHPHIVSLLDFGIASDNTPFLVMTYAPHGTLRDRHPKGSRLPLSTIISYVRPIASALQYAHSLHLVHRDVKPENILVGPSHEVLLSDFGIVAIAYSSRSLLTEQGFGGTVPYMAPEQIAGKPRAASDQYALGIVIYEWIAGSRPFKGTIAEIAVQHNTTPPPSLREQIRTLPVDVEQVVLRALAKDPKNRFANIEEFARALAQASQQAETPKPPVEHSSLVRSPLPAQDPSSVRPSTERANKGNPAISFSGVERMALVTQPVDEPFTTPTIPLTVPVISKQEPPPSRLLSPASIEIPRGFYRRRISRRTATLLLVLALLILGSAGGLYTTLRISTARTLLTATANTQAIANTRVAANAYARFVATNGVMFGFDAQHSHANPYEQILNPTTVARLTKKWVYHTGYAIDSSPAVAGGMVYIGSGDGNLYVLDAASGTKKWTYQTEGTIYSSPAVVGSVVYFDSIEGNLYALDAASGTKKWAYQTGGSYSSSPAVAGGVVYTGSGEGKLYALNAASGALLWSYQTGSPGNSPPAVVNGVVYIGSNDYYVYALDAASGTKKWAYQTGGFISSSSPAVVNGVVYVGSRDDNLYAFHLPNI